MRTTTALALVLIGYLLSDLPRLLEEEIAPEPIAIPQPPVNFAAIVAHCANGGSFAIRELLVFCDPHTVKVSTK